MRPMSLTDARYISGTLDPRNFPLGVGVDCTPYDLVGYEAALHSQTTVYAFLRQFEPNEQDLHRLRVMLVAELVGKARDSIVFALVSRHEALLKQLRLEPFFSEHPTFAAHFDKITSGGGSRRVEQSPPNLSKVWR